MKIVSRRGAELASGDTVTTWYGNHAILEILPYTGPFDFLCGIARFAVAEMTIERNGLYEVLQPD